MYDRYHSIYCTNGWVVTPHMSWRLVFGWCSIGVNHPDSVVGARTTIAEVFNVGIMTLPTPSCHNFPPRNYIHLHLRVP